MASMQKPPSSLHLSSSKRRICSDGVTVFYSLSFWPTVKNLPIKHLETLHKMRGFVQDSTLPFLYTRLHVILKSLLYQKLHLGEYYFKSYSIIFSFKEVQAQIQRIPQERYVNPFLQQALGSDIHQWQHTYLFHTQSHVLGIQKPRN